MRRLRLYAIALLVGIWPSLAMAQLTNEPLVGPADGPELDKYRYLRAMSLDTVGHPPSMDLYAELDAVGELSESMIDALLDDPMFAQRVVRHHRSLLWPNIQNVNFFAANAALRRTNMPSGYVYWVRNRATAYRGAVVECLDEPATFDASGVIQTTAWTDPNSGVTSQREGYVEVSPYWLDEGETIRVCAFDAQDAAVSTAGVTCESRAGLQDAGCGCGPELRLCRYGSGPNQDIVESFESEFEMRIANLITENKPYTELFTGDTAYVNGPIVFYLKYQTQRHANVRLHPVSVDVESLPDLHFRDKDVWVKIQLPEHHSGILTSWLFLMRYQTNRARANRFYNAFLCQPFSPPTGGIPFDEGAAHMADLQQRSGCKYCHSLLEPSSSFWGRWSENGAAFLDPVDYPALRDDCLNCALYGSQCSSECRLYYVTNPISEDQEEYLGMLNAYEFRRPEHMMNVEVGPDVLALTAVVDNRMPMCVSTKTLEWLLGRPVADDDQPFVKELANEFVAGGYSYRDMVKAVLMSSTYRRVQP